MLPDVAVESDLLGFFLDYLFLLTVDIGIVFSFKFLASVLSSTARSVLSEFDQGSTAFGALAKGIFPSYKRTSDGKNRRVNRRGLRLTSALALFGVVLADFSQVITPLMLPLIKLPWPGPGVRSVDVSSVTITKLLSPEEFRQIDDPEDLLQCRSPCYITVSDYSTESDFVLLNETVYRLQAYAGFSAPMLDISDTDLGSFLASPFGESTLGNQFRAWRDVYLSHDKIEQSYKLGGPVLVGHVTMSSSIEELRMLASNVEPTGQWYKGEILLIALPVMICLDIFFLVADSLLFKHKPLELIAQEWVGQRGHDRRGVPLVNILQDVQVGSENRSLSFWMVELVFDAGSSAGSVGGESESGLKNLNPSRAAQSVVSEPGRSSDDILEATGFSLGLATKLSVRLANIGSLGVYLVFFLFGMWYAIFERRASTTIHPKAALCIALAKSVGSVVLALMDLFIYRSWRAKRNDPSLEISWLLPGAYIVIALIVSSLGYVRHIEVATGYKSVGNYLITVAHMLLAPVPVWDAFYKFRYGISGLPLPCTLDLGESSSVDDLGDDDLSMVSRTPSAHFKNFKFISKGGEPKSVSKDPYITFAFRDSEHNGIAF